MDEVGLLGTEGEDFFAIERTYFKETLTVDMGVDDDMLLFEEVCAGIVNADGGNGDDTLQLIDSCFEELNHSNFENIVV